MENDKVFFVIPSGACFGCKKSFIEAYTKHSNDSSFYLVINEANVSELDQGVLNKNVLIDKSNSIDRLDLGIQNATLVFTSGNSLKNLIHLTPNNVDSIEVFITKYRK
jgi:hypothetical protein